MALSDKQKALIGWYYHSILDLAVKMDISLAPDEREELISMLLKTAAQESEEYPTIFIQSAINYLRGISDV